MSTGFEDRMGEGVERSGRSGWLVTLLVLGLVGAIVWFVMSQD
ncbi:MAG TPA: hypothetical protein VJ948_10155 [Acidimicrobiia bacterium]|nr:hypothetical protein [Acidimicrobiia bacterium]